MSLFKSSFLGLSSSDPQASQNRSMNCPLKVTPIAAPSTPKGLSAHTGKCAGYGVVLGIRGIGGSPRPAPLQVCDEEQITSPPGPASCPSKPTPYLPYRIRALESKPHGKSTAIVKPLGLSRLKKAKREKGRVPTS